MRTGPRDDDLLEAAQVRRVADRERERAGVEVLGDAVDHAIPRDGLRLREGRSRRRALRRYGTQAQAHDCGHRKGERGRRVDAPSHQASSFGRRANARTRMGGAIRTISSRASDSGPSNRLAPADRYGMMARGPSPVPVLLEEGEVDPGPPAAWPGPEP